MPPGTGLRLLDQEPVDGPIVYVRDAALGQLPSSPGQEIDLALTIAADRALEATLLGWLEYPDGKLTYQVEQQLSLSDVLNNQATVGLVMDQLQLGTHTSTSACCRKAAHPR